MSNSSVISFPATYIEEPTKLFGDGEVFRSFLFGQREPWTTPRSDQLDTLQAHDGVCLKRQCGSDIYSDSKVTIYSPALIIEFDAVRVISLYRTNDSRRTPGSNVKQLASLIAIRTAAQNTESTHG